MGRSVSTHSHAVATVYLHLEDYLQERDDWDMFVEDLQDNVLMSKYPSLRKCDRWEGRENHVVLENSQIEVSVSEYCGCVAICLAPSTSNHCQSLESFREAQAHRMANNFHKHITKMFKSCAMVPVGTFSTGETVFKKL